MTKTVGDDEIRTPEIKYIQIARRDKQLDLVIHKFFVIDRQKSVGHELFVSNEHSVAMSTDLLIGFIQALMVLGEEFGRSKGALREVELGMYQISVLNKDSLSYVVIHDTYDSEPFTARIIGNVIEKYHDMFLDLNFNRDLPDEDVIRADIAAMLETMKFPREVLEPTQQHIEKFLVETNWMTDTLFLTDLDDGIIKIFYSPEDDNIVVQLLEIMSEIPFERHWIGETRMFESKMIAGVPKDYEVWMIYRVGLTDFCIMGRAYLATYSERELLIQRLEELTHQISSEIMDIG